MRKPTNDGVEYILYIKRTDGAAEGQTEVAFTQVIVRSEIFFGGIAGVVIPIVDADLNNYLMGAIELTQLDGTSTNTMRSLHVDTLLTGSVVIDNISSEKVIAKELRATDVITNKSFTAESVTVGSETAEGHFTITGTGTFTGTNTFTGKNSFSDENTFSGTNTFGGTNGTNIFEKGSVNTFEDATITNMIVTNLVVENMDNEDGYAPHKLYLPGAGVSSEDAVKTVAGLNAGDLRMDGDLTLSKSPAGTAPTITSILAKTNYKGAMSGTQLGSVDPSKILLTADAIEDIYGDVFCTEDTFKTDISQNRKYFNKTIYVMDSED